jgi:serine/threonine protein phosphatase 1
VTPAAVTFIGDVHGQAALLAAALEDARRVSDLVVALGDYINVGPDSRQVVELLLSARGALGDRLVLLRGNHEQSLLDYLREPSQTAFLRMGGLATIKSYHPNPPSDILDVFRRSFPGEHPVRLRL